MHDRYVFKAIIIGTAVVVSLAVLSACAAFQNITYNQSSAPHYDDGAVHHVSAYTTRLGDNEIWCAPLQLCWNEAIKANNGKPLEGVSNESVDSLNEQGFTSEDIGEDHYYLFANHVEDPHKTYAEILRGVKDKFGQQTDLLTGDEIMPNAWFFYSMLYRKFTYQTPFTELANAEFGASKDVQYEYFGVMPEDENASSKRSNLGVLYYENKDNHAVRIDTLDGDIVVLVKNPAVGSTKEMYEAAMSNAKSYSGSRTFEEEDEFKAPVISVDATDEFKDLQGASLSKTNEAVGAAAQKTKFIMDSKGGSVKSEVYVGMTAATEGDEAKVKKEPRLFHYDNTYAVFLIDGSQASSRPNVNQLSEMKPYFAARIANLDLFQK